jgi:hypothetical protein
MVDMRRGEEHVGLPWALLTARAQGVIGSLWPVDADATVQLFHWFYRSMVEGNSPAEALRRAMRAVRGANKKWAAPYYWGAFQAIGMVLEGRLPLCCALPPSGSLPALVGDLQLASGGIDMEDYEVWVENAAELLHDMAGARRDEVVECFRTHPGEAQTVAERGRDIAAQSTDIANDQEMVAVARGVFDMVYECTPLRNLLLTNANQLWKDLDADPENNHAAEKYHTAIHDDLVSLLAQVERLAEVA